MKIKYMGLADIRRLEKGEDFGGRLGEPLDRDIEWNWENRHVIDTDDFDGVSDEFWSMLVAEDDFRDVTDAKRIPTNAAQQTWKAMPKTESDPDPSVKKSGTAETDETDRATGGPSEATASPSSTTTGGSTRGGGRTGGSTRSS